MTTKILTIANHKGGVAKSQTALELAIYLMLLRFIVLLVDIDPQANASDILLAGNHPTGRTLPEILIAGDKVRQEDVMTRSFSSDRSIDYVCSSIQATRIESRITASPKEYVIGDALQEVKDKYDFIVIDTPPSAELLSLSTLIAADEVIIPVTPDKPSIDGVASIMKTIKAVQDNPRLNPTLKVRGILVTRYRAAISTMRGIRALKDSYGDLVEDTPIRECTRVQQAVECCRPILDFDPSCNAAKDYTKAFEKMLTK